MWELPSPQLSGAESRGGGGEGRQLTHKPRPIPGGEAGRGGAAFHKHLLNALWTRSFAWETSANTFLCSPVFQEAGLGQKHPLCIVIATPGPAHPEQSRTLIRCFI